LRPGKKATTSIILTILTTLAWATGCKSIIERQDVRPRVLRDVPAQRLAYRLEPDITPPAELKLDELSDKIATIQNDFSTRRPDEALLRTVPSPDGQRALALYGTEDAPSSAFRIDMYAADGKFLRNLIPPDLSCVFPETVSWSPDGNYINFIAHKRAMPSPTPTPLSEALPDTPSIPSPSIAPAFPAVASFDTEQIYICNRDGYDLKALTSREGLIYFYFAWAPDNHALVALACKEGAFQAGLAGHNLADGKRAALDLWQKLEPSAAPITVSANQSALASVSLRGWAPAIIPVPVPPFTKLPITASCAHTIERFQPGSGP